MRRIACFSRNRLAEIIDLGIHRSREDSDETSQMIIID